MKYYYFKFFKFSFPILALIIFINVFIDSGFLFRKSIKNEKIARILVSGKNAGVRQIPSEWGDLQVQIIKESKKEKKTTKEILVFGTSRSSEICSGFFKNKTLRNCVIPGGTVNDLIALFGLYLQHDQLPEYVIVNMDFSTFHSRKPVIINDNVHYISDTTSKIKIRNDLLKPFKYGSSFIGDTTIYNNIYSAENKTNFNILSLFKSSLNIDYFQTNLKSSRKPLIISTSDNKTQGYFTINSDGSYSLAEQSRLDSTKTLLESKEYVDIHKNSFFIANDTNTIYFNRLKTMLLQFKDLGVTPILYISPINPYVFDNIKNTPNVPTENAISAFCKKHDIIKIGSFNPHIYCFHSIGNYFIDAYHPVKSVVKSIFIKHESELDSIGIIVN